MDSPLTTFREGSSNEEVSGEIQTAFFENLSTTPLDEQIIILENKEPNSSVQSKINYIEFVGDKAEGRSGFFPT